MEQLLDEIREHIGDPDIEAKLWDNKPHFNQICSSLDTIGDTQYAIDAYFNSECGETLGALYIAVYGLFLGIYIATRCCLSYCAWSLTGTHHFCE